MEKDKDGYYHVVLGKFSDNLAEGVFEALQQRSAQLLVRGEYGRPKRLPDQPIEDFIRRIQVIDPDKIGIDILNIRKSEDGQHILGDVKPSGVFRRIVEEYFDTTPNAPEFGMRGYKLNGRLTNILTFDLIHPE